MKSHKTRFKRVQSSLRELLGGEYTDAVCKARSFLTGEDEGSLKKKATEKVNFYPQEMQQRLLALLPNVGEACISSHRSSNSGAATQEFQNNSKLHWAPLSGYGYLRLSEEGRLFLLAKSEHYHVSLGHGFPGYRLIETARQLGIPNATHNNTRGTITRIAEEELLRSAAGLEPGDSMGIQKILSSKKTTDLNRVLNLQTGSLAAEAALKIILSRFYKPLPESSQTEYAGCTPILLVIGDEQGGLSANYHGTTMVTQFLRGMWPDLYRLLDKNKALLVRSVRANRLDELEAAFKVYEDGPYKIAGFFIELVLMNYGAKRLSEKFVKRMESLCRKNNVPLVVDEIQTCIWSPQIFMYREYGIKPNMVVVGKGFPGGEYAASRILFNRGLDQLPQFGALVTNGQEELASLAYLITMRWAQRNADVTAAVGEYYEERLAEMAEQFPEYIVSIEGRRHLAGIYFHDLEIGKRFTRRLNELGLDISVQNYKESCPPSALTKLPLIAGYEVVDFVVERMRQTLKEIG